MFNTHHIISDAWSVGVFFRELASLYAANCGFPSARLSEPAIQYADFAMWQREMLQAEALEQQLAHWKKQL